MKRSPLISPFCFAAAALSALAFTPAMPPRGGDQVNYRLAASILSPDTTALNIWDFSNVATQKTGVTFSYSQRGDSLFSERRPGIRRDYRLRGDSLMLVRTETHNWRVDLTGSGAPYALSSLGGDEFFINVSERGRQYLKDSLRGEGEAALRLVTSGTLRFPDNIEIAGVNLYERTITSSRYCPDYIEDGLSADSLTWTHIERVYTWEHPSLRYPLVETRISLDSLLAGGYLSASATSVFCYPSDQPLEPTAPERSPMDIVHSSGGDTEKRVISESSNSSGALPTSLTVETSAGGDRLSISGEMEQAGIVEFILCDISGRVYASVPPSRYAAASPLSIDLDIKLPPGTYLLRAVSGTDEFTVKFRIDR